MRFQKVDWRSDLLEKYIAAHARGSWVYSGDVMHSPSLELGWDVLKNVSNKVWHEIENLPPEKKAEFVLTIADYMRQSVEEYSGLYYDLSHTLNKLLREVPSYSVADLLRLFDWSLSQTSNYYHCVYLCVPRLVKLASISQKEHGLDKELKERLERLIEVFAKKRLGKQEKSWISAAKAIVGHQAVRPPVIAGEAWADAVIADVEAGALAPTSDWLELLEHCRLADGSAPNAKWLKTAAKSLDAIGFDDFRAALLRWFPLVDKPRTQPIEGWAGHPAANLLLNDVNADILKGLVWLCAQREDKELARALCALAISTYRKVPGVGQRSVRVGNACVWALGNLPGKEGVGQLALLKLKVKFGAAQKGIEKAMMAAANRMGLPPAEIEELSAPTYGLQAVGCMREQLGEFTAELVITGTHDVELRWRKPDGNPQSSVPRAVKEGHGEQLKELQQAAKDIVRMLPAQRDRIENLYLEQKRWPFAIWRERYLDHPLIGALARRLIWRFSQGERQASAIWWDGQLVGVNGEPLAWLPMAGPDDGTIVELWHPLYESTEQALAWREWLNQREVRQPFKQAHREIYVLTEAERNTSVYSNRFAAHIIKQHQFNALCANRAWKNKLRLLVDDEYPPAQRHMAAWNLRAEFWIEGLSDNYGADTTETGSYLYLTTDQVRFYPLEAPQHMAHAGGGGYDLAHWSENVANEPLQLTEIPPLVFTEIMRDVDLFVGVASVANDPNWADGGANGRHVDYWRNHSFGELTATAATRKQVLERLVPRLKIADRCRFGERFLIVRGELRTYKIHLGSGNILMEPNDQYLCIVPGRGVAESANGKIFLPFEGDNMLAIILSKAFLLADDKKIKDPTITRQLH